MDPATVAAGFLHDVVEDTEVTLDDMILEANFNEEVAMLVDGVTKLGKLNINRKKSNRRKIIEKCLWLWRKIFGSF